MPFPEPPENRKLSPAIFRVTRAKAPKFQNPTEFSYLTTLTNRILWIPPNGITPSERIPETAELPRAARSAYRRRSGIPMLYTFLTAAGLILGIYIAASAPGTDISGSLLCVSGDFLGLLLRRLFWGAAFLISEYVCGFFALGRLLVWAAPLICGLGTGAALAGAFTIEGMNALRLAPGCAGCAAAVIFAAGTSSGMSSQLLRLVSSDKNSIVSTSPAAGEYTLRFLVYLAILSACAIAEAALRCA